MHRDVRRDVFVLFLAAVSCCALRVVPATGSPAVAVHAQRVLLPLVTENDLDAGVAETDPSRGAFALVIGVTVPPDDAEGWALYVRSDRPTFTGEGIDKPCSDLELKLDDAPESDYHSLDEHEFLLLTRPEGGSARITLDVRVHVDWSTESGPYELPIVFRAAPD